MVHDESITKKEFTVWDKISIRFLNKNRNFEHSKNHKVLKSPSHA